VRLLSLLYLSTPQVSCDLLTQNGRRSTLRVELRLFLPRTMSLAANILLRTFKLSKYNLCVYFCAVISNSLNLINLASHPLNLLNRQNQCSTYGLRLYPSPTQSVLHSDTRDGLQYYIDTTHTGMGTMVSWCLGVVGSEGCQYIHVWLSRSSLYSPATDLPCPT
jgi:hypothetical protein